MLLIVVTFLEGATWGLRVSIQKLPNASACIAAMNVAAQTIENAAKSNINVEVIIQNDYTGGL